MSGFLCILNTEGTPIDPALLRQMTDEMAFCGPDGQTTWHTDHIGLGHAQLRTTVEDAHEHQPCSLDGEIWITADARIDGRGDLMRQLRSHGRTVVDGISDGELILHAYHVWGQDCLQHLLGDFAFVLWDGPQHLLLCAHDHFGVVPLYYAHIGPWLLVSNTLASLLVHPDISTTLNEQAVADYLHFMINQDLTTTFYADIRRLAPANKLVWSQAETRIQPYWTMPEGGEFVRYQRGIEYVEHFQELFEQAVSDRLRTDAVGTHLSGGLDASSIAVTAKRLLAVGGKPFDLRAYTIVFERLIPDDERRYAALIAAEHDLPIEYLIADDYITRQPNAAPGYMYPEPVMIADQSPEAEITRRTATYARVLLAGFGGDPAFSGDPTYLRGLLHRGQYGLLLVALARHVAMNRSMRGIGLRSAVQRHDQRNPVGSAIPRWLDPDFVKRVEARGGQQPNLLAPEDRGRQGMVTGLLWPSIFAWADPGFSGKAVKLRYPFFDLRLIRYLDTVPPIPWLPRKTLLRAAMRDILPEPVRRRPKTPLRGHGYFEWQRQSGVQPWIEDLLALPELTAYVNREAVLETLRAPEHLTPATSKQLLAVLSFAYWLRHRTH